MKVYLILDENERYIDAYTSVTKAMGTLRTTHKGHNVTMGCWAGNGARVTVDCEPDNLVYLIQEIEPKDRSDHL